VRRAAILLEVLVSLAILVGVSGFSLHALADAEAGLDRADRRRRCMDAASSVAAMLDAGLIGVGDLRSDSLPRVDGVPLDVGTGHPLECDASSDRTEWPGIVLLTLEVKEQTEGVDRPVSATLRQLVLLKAHTADVAEEDVDLEGLQ